MPICTKIVVGRGFAPDPTGIELYANTFQTYLDQLIKTNNEILRILLRRKLDTPVVQLYKSYNTLPIPLLFRFNINILVHRVLFGPEGLPTVYRDYFFLLIMIFINTTPDIVETCIEVL